MARRINDNSPGSQVASGPARRERPAPSRWARVGAVLRGGLSAGAAMVRVALKAPEGDARDLRERVFHPPEW